MNATENRQWIRASVQEWLTSTFPSVTFNFGDNRTDLDKLLANASPIVLVDFLKRSGPILNDATLVTWPMSLTVIAKLNADPYGGDVDTTVSTIKSGLRHALIPIKDYTTPSAPVATGYYVRPIRLDDDDASPDDVIRAIVLTAELHYIERA